MSTLLTAQQAADRAGVARTTIYSAREKGLLKLAPNLPEGVVRFLDVDVDAWAASERNKGGRPTKPIPVKPKKPFDFRYTLNGDESKLYFLSPKALAWAEKDAGEPADGVTAPDIEILEIVGELEAEGMKGRTG